MYYRTPIILIYLFCTIFLYGDGTGLISYRPISLHGMHYFKADEIYKAVGIDQKSFYEFWKRDDPRIKTSLIPTLEASLQSFYHSEGFYDVVFTIKDQNESINVTVTENKPVIVTDINITSDYDINTIVSFKKGLRFRAEEFVSVKESIIKAMMEKGYCSYDLDSKAYVDLEKHSVDLVYKLKKGGICTLGDMTIKGLETIDEKIVMSKAGVQKGDTYTLQAANKVYENLYTLGAFESIIVNTNRKFYNVVPVDITVQELTQPYHIELGGGYDTYVGFRVLGEVTKYNFLGDAQRLKLKALWSQEEQLAILTFYKPVLFELFDRGVDFGTELGYSNLIYDGFKEEKSFIKGYLESQYGRLIVRSGITFESIMINEYDNVISNQLQQAITEGNFILVYPYIDLVFDARDSKLDPHNGYYLASYLEYGLTYDEEATDYVKMLFEGRSIYSIGKLTLAGIGKVGILEVNEGLLPESKFFFAGGPFSNRAYGYRELGVILSSTEDSIYGASTWLNLSIEANYPIYKALYGAVFVDNTMLSEKSFDFGGEMITSAGIGVRYMTPIGPLKVDVGFNIHDPAQYAIAFQIGQSF